jgi:hypothetical protein
LEDRTELGRDALHDRLDARRELLVGEPLLAAAGAERGGGEHRGEQRERQASDLHGASLG